MRKFIKLFPLWLSLVVMMCSFYQWFGYDTRKSRVQQVQWYSEKGQPVRTNDRDLEQMSYPEVISPQGGSFLGLFYHKETDILWTMTQYKPGLQTSFRLAYIDIAKKRGQILPFPKNMPIDYIWGLAAHPNGNVAVVFESSRRYALALIHHERGVIYTSFLSDEPNRELLAMVWEGTTIHIAIQSARTASAEWQQELQATFIIANSEGIQERNIFKKNIFPNARRSRIVGIFMGKSFWEFVVETLYPNQLPKYFQVDLQGNYRQYPTQNSVRPPYFFCSFPMGCFETIARSYREVVIHSDGSNQTLMEYLQDFHCPMNGFISTDYAASNEKNFLIQRYFYYRDGVTVWQKVKGEWLELSEVRKNKGEFATIKVRGADEAKIIGRLDSISREGDFVKRAMIIKRETGYQAVSPAGYYVTLDKNFQRLDPYSFWKNLSFRHWERSIFRKPYNAVYLMLWCLFGLFVCLAFSLLGYWLYGKKEKNPLIQHLQWGASIYLLSGSFCYWLLSPLF